jgi:opacity protein-like surface antigen
MKSMKTWWRVTFLTAALSAAATAQVAEFAVSAGRSLIGNKELGSGYSLDDGFRMAFRLTINNWNHFGQEFGYAYNRTHLNVASEGGATQDLGGMAIHQGFYNLLAYATPEGKMIRPFVTGGGHFSNFVPPGASAAQGQGSNKFGFNYGGGVKVRVGEKWQVRMDVRQFITGKPFGEFFPVSGSLRQTEVSVGLGIVL